MIVEPPAGSKWAKKKFVNGRWMSAKKFHRQHLKLRRVRKRVIHGVVVKDSVSVSKPRPMREFERSVTVVGDVSNAVVRRMEVAGVKVTRRSD